jgi:hypothetical protein
MARAGNKDRGQFERPAALASTNSRASSTTRSMNRQRVRMRCALSRAFRFQAKGGKGRPRKIVSQIRVDGFGGTIGANVA